MNGERREKRQIEYVMDKAKIELCLEEGRDAIEQGGKVNMPH